MGIITHIHYIGATMINKKGTSYTVSKDNTKHDTLAKAKAHLKSISKTQINIMPRTKEILEELQKETNSKSMNDLLLKLAKAFNNSLRDKIL